MHNVSVELGSNAKLNGDSLETEQVKEEIEKVEGERERKISERREAIEGAKE